MSKLLKQALVGALTVAGVALATLPASAMPVSGLTPAMSDTAGIGPGAELARWVRPGWHRRHGWHRGWHPGWRRPLHPRWHRRRW